MARQRIRAASASASPQTRELARRLTRRGADTRAAKGGRGVGSGKRGAGSGKWRSGAFRKRSVTKHRTHSPAIGRIWGVARPQYDTQAGAAC